MVVVLGAVLTRRALRLEQDMDLRCLVGGQAAATEMPADTTLHSAVVDLVTEDTG